MNDAIGADATATVVIASIMLLLLFIEASYERWIPLGYWMFLFCTEMDDKSMCI